MPRCTDYTIGNFHFLGWCTAVRPVVDNPVLPTHAAPRTDWVKARSDCTVRAVFKKLAEDVKGDIARFANLHPGPAQSREFGDCGKDRFLSSLSKPIGLCSRREDAEIHIVRWAYKGAQTPLMVLKVGLDDDGNCVLIDEEQNALMPWQVRRRALEETFFKSQ